MTKYVIFVGIDISKQWFNVALYWSDLKGQYPAQKFKNNRQGFEAFYQWVRKQADRHQLKGAWYVCMEHTGTYGLPLAYFLEEHHIKVVMECPLRISRSLGLSRGKSDAIDAKRIAVYAHDHHGRIKVRPLPSPVLLEVQTLLSLRHRLVRYNQGLSVAAKELEGFVELAISSNIAQRTSPVSSLIKEQIEHIDRHIKQMLCSDSRLERLYHLVRSVIGIGPLIAAYLLVYTNGFTAFTKSRPFSCYIGTAPFPHSSGTSVRRPDQVSYLANKRIKALISTAATVAVQYDPQLKAFFQRKKAEGKDNAWIYNAVKNKILHRVFAVVKRDTPYVKMDKHVG